MTVAAHDNEDAELAAIARDDSLSEVDKARKRQALVNARVLQALEEEASDEVRGCHGSRLQDYKCAFRRD